MRSRNSLGRKPTAGGRRDRRTCIDNLRSAPADIASTMSLMVTPRCLAVSFTSASASVAVANFRCASTLWFMKLGGGVNGRVSSGESLLGLLRTRLHALRGVAHTPGNRPI